MSAHLAFNLALLVLIGALLMWFPDRLTLVPLILSKVQAPIPPAEPPREQPAARRRPGRRPATRAKKKPAKKPVRKRR